MNHPSFTSSLLRRGILALAAATLMGTQALAATPYVEPGVGFNHGAVPENTKTRDAAHPGSTVSVKSGGLIPGQKVQLLLNGEKINEGEITVDDRGGFKATVKIPQDAAIGIHDVVVQASNPANAAIYRMNVVPQLDFFGAELFDMQSVSLGQPGLYQSEYSPSEDALFVTAASGVNPVKNSALLKVDAKTLKVIAKATPPLDESRDDGQVHAVYGLALDNERGNVWTSNTRTNTVSVYRQDDLSHVKTFPRDQVRHPRYVVMDAKFGRVYFANANDDTIGVYDAEKLEFMQDIHLGLARYGGTGGHGSRVMPSAMDLVLHPDKDEMYAVSRFTDDVFVIDRKTLKVERAFPVPELFHATGVAVIPERNLLAVSAQNSNNMVLVDLETGKTQDEIIIGDGALHTFWEPDQKLIYTNSRADHSMAVIDADGKMIANVQVGSYPNHFSRDGKGNVYLINKSMGPDDLKGDLLTRITLKR